VSKESSPKTSRPFVNSVGKFGVLRWHRRWASVNRKNFVAYRSKQALLISNVPVQRSRLHSKTLSQTSHGQVSEPVRVENLYSCPNNVRLRQAHDDVVDVLNSEGWPDRIIMHCYSGDADLARICLDHGAYLSFSGTITFNSAGPQRDALAIAPDNRILVETDAPFLTPAPRRGKRNGPYLLPHTARFIAKQRGWDELRVCQQLTENAFAAYGGAW